MDEPPRSGRGKSGPVAKRKKRPESDERISAADVIAFIEEVCFIPEGKHVGEKLKLYDWQKREIERIYDNPVGTRRAILSFGRKNGKTTFAACLLLAHLCGPPAQSRPNSQLFSAAQSRDQAAIIFSLAAKMVRMNPVLSRAVTIRETAKELICPELGTRYRALSADATTAFGLSPAMVDPRRAGSGTGSALAALRSARDGDGRAGRSAVDRHFHSGADRCRPDVGADRRRATPAMTRTRSLSLYTAPTDLDPFDEETIRLANPAFGTFLSAKEVLAMAKDAQRMPAREAEYRNLILNQRVEVSNPFIAPAVWKACGGPVGPLEGVPLYGGLDLSEAADLTALVLIGKRDGKWRVQPTFWLPSEGLSEKSVADRVPYDMWARQGYLQTTPGRSISYEFVASYLRDVFRRYDVRKLAFDRWNFKHLLPWLLKAGMSEQFVKDHFVEFGQGMQSMSPALRDLEQVLLEGELAHGNHPVLTMCVTNTVIAVDDAGNRKPSKRKSTGRIDGMIALAMAVGVAPLLTKQIDISTLIV